MITELTQDFFKRQRVPVNFVMLCRKKSHSTTSVIQQIPNISFYVFFFFFFFSSIALCRKLFSICNFNDGTKRCRRIKSTSCNIKYVIRYGQYLLKVTKILERKMLWTNLGCMIGAWKYLSKPTCTILQKENK